MRVGSVSNRGFSTLAGVRHRQRCRSPCPAPGPTPPSKSEAPKIEQLDCFRNVAGAHAAGSDRKTELLGADSCKFAQVGGEPGEIVGNCFTICGMLRDRRRAGVPTRADGHRKGSPLPNRIESLG